MMKGKTMNLTTYLRKTSDKHLYTDRRKDHYRTKIGWPIDFSLVESITAKIENLPGVIKIETRQVRWAYGTAKGKAAYVFIVRTEGKPSLIEVPNVEIKKPMLELTNQLNTKFRLPEDGEIVKIGSKKYKVQAL